MHACIYAVVCMCTLLGRLAAMDTFSSMATLRGLKDDQDRMVEIVEKYIDSEFQRLAELRRSLENARLSLRTYSHGHSRDYLENPIDAYTLIRDWATVSAQALYRNDFYDHTFRNTFPDNIDHSGAIRSLLRLQRVYNLSTADIAAGNIRGHQSFTSLHKNDYYDLGCEAKNRGMYRNAFDWMNLAMNQLPTHVKPQEVYYTAAELYYFAGDYAQAVSLSKKASGMDPSNHTLRSKVDFYNKILETAAPSLPVNDDRYLPMWKKNYQILCRGDQLEWSPRWYNPKSSWCEYRRSLVHYAPYKIEVISSDPWITLYYDIITDREANMLKERAKPQLLRAAVGDPAKSYATEERISKVAWLWDHFDEGKQVTRISRRIQEATGLSTAYFTKFSHSEPFQIVNYGMGGQYEPHMDVYENLEHLANVPDFIKGTGDRVATFMFYLSEVKEGGATVFPKVGAYVPPVKNAAAFWYNIHRSGKLDLRTQHAGCPVLVGEKWVANKWIREIGQIFRRPCGLNENATETEAKAVQKPQFRFYDPSIELR